MIKPTFRIAVVENKHEIRLQRIRLVNELFPSVEVRGFACAQDIVDALEQDEFFHVILSDMYMPKRGENLEEEGSWQDGGERILEWIEARRSDQDYESVQLILISRTVGSRALPVDVLTPEREDWVDYLSDRFSISANWAIWEFRKAMLSAMRRAAPQLADDPPPVGEEDFNLNTQSQEVRALYQRAQTIASTDRPVLIEGETGSGKQLLARFIHDKSPRAARPYVKVDCSLRTGDLFESAMFGHERGAFTGATATRKGFFALADGGSIFLDELQNLSVENQGKLLRVLEEGVITPVGGKDTTINVRVIAATNVSLESKDDFRQDLYYRFFSGLQMPPLRERRNDIRSLAEYFTQKFKSEYCKAISYTLDPRLISLMEAYDWPGNFRELRNAIDWVILFSRTSVIQLEDLPPIIRPKLSQSDSRSILTQPASENDACPTNSEICEALQTHLEVTGAATALGISRQTINNRGKADPAIRSLLSSLVDLRRAKKGNRPRTGIKRSDSF